MATYTPNYGLHQWVPEDKFLRTDFNEDLSRIDTAVAAAAAQADRALDGLGTANYNIYNLLLQNYYESKATGYKKALLFDGFMDGGQVESREPGLELDTKAHVLRLAALGESDGGQGTPGTLSKEQTTVNANPTWKPTGSGHLTGLTLYFTGVLHVEVLEEGTAAPLASGTFTGAGQAGQFYPLEADVGAGRTYTIHFTNPQGPVIFYYSGTAWLAFTRHVTPVPITRAAMTTPAVQPGISGYSGALAWVRYQGGSVTLALNDGTGWREMTADSIRSTVNADGTACQEAAFSLEGLTGSTLQARFTLSGEAGVGCSVYDYGIAVL